MDTVTHQQMKKHRDQHWTMNIYRSVGTKLRAAVLLHPSRLSLPPIAWPRSSLTPLWTCCAAAVDIYGHLMYRELAAAVVCVIVLFPR